MVSSDREFTGSIPELYDTFLVPLIFESYARDLANRVISQDTNAVLEIAAGSGVVPRALAPMLSKEARYVATDLNQSMLDHAKELQPGSAVIEWRQADALDLPFEDDSFDTVICQFGVMFFPDRIQGFREARRVLRPGGRYIFNVWDKISENVFADIATQAAAEIFPDDPPRFLARTPHGHYDAARTVAELKEAGFGEANYGIRADQSKAASPDIPAIAYCQGTPLRNEIEERDPSKLQAVTDRTAAMIEATYGGAEVSAKIQALVFTAV